MVKKRIALLIVLLLFCGCIPNFSRSAENSAESCTIGEELRVRTLAEADGQAEQDDEAQEDADGAEQDARRADKKETASRAGTEHSGRRTVTTADRTQAQAARTAD